MSFVGWLGLAVLVGLAAVGLQSWLHSRETDEINERAARTRERMAKRKRGF
jgi:hypothetical protein